MEHAELGRLAAEALYLVLLISGPALLVSLVVGFGVGLFQAVTQVQEQTLSVVPKLGFVALTLVLAGGWMASLLVHFTDGIWVAIPELVR